ncbi:MAG: cellulase family glycosylhydrolase [Anaerolineae bacterium]|nr:cellulase family glycosylhydrolase [Anaerolineae bacterium]
MKYKVIIISLIGLLAVAGIAVVGRQPIQIFLFNITGEEATLPQISGAIQYGLTRLQPPLATADSAPVRYADVNPYGVNTFLQNEVEPAKRETAMRLISEAGITWIRQEFPWEDIEIHGKGDFEDRRHEPYRPAWEKYDQIVDLAEQYDVKIMARLSNPPAWTRALTDTIGTFAPPDDLTDYGDFVEAVATRYQGRIAAYQIWNEPNIFPEWGYKPISAEEYTSLLKEGYTRIKAVDPDAIVVMGALAATIELDRERRYDANGWPVSPGGLSDVLFLQQMYNAGAAPYFDVLAMQGYGLWSGPTDRRMQPRVLNFSRPLYIRDVMVRNGDAHKAIWLSELSWNALPPESGLPPVYGQVTLDQQARYTALAYERMQREWPWLGVGFYWFFKQADDRERETNPQYYFRMVEPDFSSMPVYEAIKSYANQPPIMYSGWHQASHWAVTYQGDWQSVTTANALFEDALEADQPGDTASFVFEGQALSLAFAGDSGKVQVRVDQATPVEIETEIGTVSVAAGLGAEPHTVTVEVIEGPVLLDGVIVKESGFGWSRAGGLVMGVIVVGGLWLFWRQQRSD